MFKTLEGHLGVFEDDEGVKSKVFNNDEDPEKYDNHTQTYSEKGGRANLASIPKSTFNLSNILLASSIIPKFIVLPGRLLV